MKNISTLEKPNQGYKLNPSQEKFIEEVQKLMAENENIIWAASPLRKRSVAILSGNQSAALLASSITLLVLISSFFAYLNERYILIAFITLIGIFLFSLLDIWKIWNRSHTHYALSEKRLFIQLWNKWKPEIHSIYLSQLKYFSVDKNNDESGVIHLVCHQHTAIFTMDLVTTDIRIHPTLENIQNPERLTELLLALKVRNER